jgi:hypothetical protein
VIPIKETVISNGLAPPISGCFCCILFTTRIGIAVCGTLVIYIVVIFQVYLVWRITGSDYGVGGVVAGMGDVMVVIVVIARKYILCVSASMDRAGPTISWAGPNINWRLTLCSDCGLLRSPHFAPPC